MNIQDFKETVNGENLKATVEAIKGAVKDYINNIDIQEEIEILEYARESNPHIEFLFDNFGHPLLDGEIDLYFSNEKMIEFFDEKMVLELTPQQEVALNTLKNDDFFNIIAANSVITSKDHLNLLTVNVVENLTANDIKGLTFFIDQKNGIEFEKSSLNEYVKGLVNVAESGHYDLTKKTKFFHSAAAMMNYEPFGLTVEQAYNTLLENKEENDKINKEVVDKLYSKIVNNKEAFNPTKLELLKSDMEFEKKYGGFDDYEDDEEKPKSRNKMKM